jgi:AraC-like DNA-binding protein
MILGPGRRQVAGLSPGKAYIMNLTVFDSNALPAHLDDRARVSRWYDTYSATTLRNAEVSCLPDRPFSANWQFLQSDLVIIDRFDSTLERFSRRVAAQPVERFCLAFNTGQSRVSVAQRGRELVGGLNNAGFFCMADATDILGQGNGLSWIGMSLPRKSLLDRVPDADDLVLKPLDPANPALGYLRPYLGLIAGLDVMVNEPELAQYASAALVDLVALALGARREIAELAQRGGLRAARLQAVLAAIKKGFTDPAFSANDVGLKLGVSSNYVQKLLHETGSNFTERVLELRLQKSRSMLASPQHYDVKVSEIAYVCGFNEISYFNRCFRRRFGAAPNEYRGKRHPVD